MKILMEIKCLLLLGQGQRSCYCKKSDACDGIRKGGQMNKGNIKKSLGTQKIKIPIRLLNAERKEA